VQHFWAALMIAMPPVVADVTIEWSVYLSICMSVTHMQPLKCCHNISSMFAFHDWLNLE